LFSLEFTFSLVAEVLTWLTDYQMYVQTPPRAPASRGGCQSRCILPGCQTPLALLVLSKSPLVAFDLHPAVLADGRWHCLDPIGRTLPYQFPSWCFDAPCLLVASQSRSSGYKPCL
jgi:hypothetical protein